MKKENNHSERAHAELGGSSAHRWLHCTGSVLLSRQVPEPPASDAARDGERKHELAETEVNKLINYYQKGEKPLVDGMYDTYDYSIHEEEDVATVITLLYEEVFKQQLTGKIVKTETKFIVDERFDMSGTADVWAVYRDNYGKRAGLVVDYKFGHDPVEVAKNAQLAFYAVGLWKYVQSKGKDLDYVRTVVLQPKTSPAFKEETITAKGLESWEKKFLDAAHRIYVKKDFKYKVGDWCKFCPGKPLCKAYLKTTEKSLDLNIVNIEETEFPEPETLDIDTVEKLVLNLEIIHEYMNRCREYFISQLRGGYESKALKIVEGAGRRGWKKGKDEAIIKYLKKLGVKEPTQAELKNIGAIEKELSGVIRASKKLKGEALKNMTKELLSKATEFGKTSYKLVPITDERPAVKSAISLFSAETEE